MSDHCGSVVHADEPGASISVQDCLVRLKGGGRTELQLQEFRAGDRVQTERVHTRKVRQPLRSSSSWRGPLRTRFADPGVRIGRRGSDLSPRRQR
jgi:hypothetical protein